MPIVQFVEGFEGASLTRRTGRAGTSTPWTTGRTGSSPRESHWKRRREPRSVRDLAAVESRRDSRRDDTRDHGAGRGGTGQGGALEEEGLEVVDVDGRGWTVAVPRQGSGAYSR